MENNNITAKVTLILDGNWASNLTPEELKDTITVRLDHALGFRGHVKKLKTDLPK